MISDRGAINNCKCQHLVNHKKNKNTKKPYPLHPTNNISFYEYGCQNGQRTVLEHRLQQQTGTYNRNQPAYDHSRYSWTAIVNMVVKNGQRIKLTQKSDTIVRTPLVQHQLW